MSRISMRQFQGSGSEWNAMIGGLPGPHILQTWEWSQVKAAHGWEPHPYLWEMHVPSPTAGDSRRETAGAPPVAAAIVLKRQILSRPLTPRLCLLYVPKGPLMDWGRPDLRQQVLEDLQGLARRERAVFLKIDPDIEVGRGVPGDSAARDVAEAQTIAAELMRWHWRFSSDQIQFRNTVLLNLALSEDAMLARMKQKARYNVRLGEKKGVIVRLGTHTDLASLYTLYAETAIRDGFVIRNEGYYRMVWEAFLGSPETPHQPSGELLIAQVDGETVAAIILFYFAQRAYYMYGMSREIHREKMPNHVLQWEAMKRARERGCLTYDLWGAPDVFNANDPMWGVFRFKEGLGGEVVRTIGAWDFPASSFWYPVYTRLVPRLLDIMRARGRQRTRQALAGV